MTRDPLDDLKAALRDHTPPASDEARARALAAARKNFSQAAQGSLAGLRPNPDRPVSRPGFWKGISTMIERMTAPRMLMATSAIATVAIAVVLTQQTGFSPIPGSRPLPAPVSQATEESAVTAAPDRASILLPPMDELRADGDESKQAAQPVPAAPPAPAAADGSVLQGDIAAALEINRSMQADIARQRGAAARLAREPVAEAEAPMADMLFAPDAAPPVTFESSTERYPDAAPNPLKLTAQEPVSTFSIDVDTASYALVRSSLTQGVRPPKEAVRIEEMINYFDYAYPAPADRTVPFATSVSVAPTPWNEHTRLLHIGIQGYDLPAAARPALNLVFLIDTSGSMEDPNKLPLLVRSFGLLLDQLGPQDSVAIVTYAGSAGLALEPTPASERAKILRSLNSLSAGGSTAGQDGLQQAYAVAEEMSAEGEVSRVILATDGDFNVGLSDPQALEDFIADRRDSGIYLSVLGFGRGNYNDAIMQSLAQNGNGTAAYIDTLSEAQKVLVAEASGALFPIAGDVKIQVEFNPAQVSEYRLIGYETRALRREDFNNDAVDAGEIGAGHTVTAIYEITPKGSPAERIGDLRYAAPPTGEVDSSRELAFVKLRYKLPGEDRSHLVETPVLPDRQDIAPGETQFAAAVAGFGELLRGSDAISGWGWDDALALASAARGEDPFGYRAEFLNLVRLAKVAQ